MDNELIIGMIGAGYAAHLRARSIMELNSSRLHIKAVHDKNPVHSSEFSKELDVPSFNSLEDMCKNKKINTLSVAVPNKYHYEIVKYALNSGKNVICEYPLVIDEYKRAEELVLLAEKKKLFLHVGQTMNYDWDYRLVETYRKELGKLYMGYKYMSFGGEPGSWFELDGFKGKYNGLARWYIEDTRKGGWIVSAHYHGIQHFRKIFGEVVFVCAFDSSSDGVAAASVLLRHDNGASSTVQWGMPVQGKWFNMLIVSGSEGSVEINGSDFLVHTSTLTRNGKIKGANPFVEDLKCMLDELSGKRDHHEENQDMLKNLKVALCAERSAVEGKVIKIDYM